MKHSTFSHADFFILDGQNYRYMSAAAEGIVLTMIDPPHSSCAISHAELEALMTSPGFRFVRGGLERAASERSLSGLPPHFRDLPQAKREIALWRQAYVEEFLAQVQGGQAKRNEASVAAILPTLITAVTTRQRQAQSHRGKRAGRLEAGRTPPCPKTLLTWTRRYERSGFDVMALVPLSCRSGRHGGWLDPGEIVLFQKLIAGYASPLRPSIDQIRERARNLYAGFNEHREEEGLPPVRAPSRSRVYRAIKRLDPYETYVQRYGIPAANRKFAIMEYGAQAVRPMGRVETDEWEVDLMTHIDEAGLLDQLSPAEVACLTATRLWVGVALDCATRCVVGLCLCRSPTSTAAVRTIELATTDKTAIASEFGCLHGWPQGGQPEIIVADQGSAFVSEEFKMMAGGLRARLVNPPAGVPKLRGRIERLFGTFASHFVSRFRGRTFSDPLRRGDYSAEAEASLSDQELLEAFVTYIVDIYHQRPHSGLFGETPAQCWDRLVQKHGAPAPVDGMDRRALFGTELERKVSGRGVRAFGADYACEPLREAYKHGHQREVRIRIDPMDLGWVAVEIDNRWYPARDLSGALSGISLHQWRCFAQTVREKTREGAEMTAEVFHEGLRRLDLISEEAARAAQLGRMLYTASEIDAAERALGLGLHLLPASTDNDAPPASDWFSRGIEVGPPEAATPEPTVPRFTDDEAALPTPKRSWRIERDD